MKPYEAGMLVFTAMTFVVLLITLVVAIVALT